MSTLNIPNLNETRFRSTIAAQLQDLTTGALMTHAVTVVPCGHSFNESTVIQCIARDHLCPIDHLPITSYGTNDLIRSLSSTVAHFSEEGLSVEQTRATQRAGGGSVAPSVPTLAFGAAEWAKYIGDVGEEPPLSANIEEILNSPCSIWPDRRVKDTHLLVLIPETVNGNPYNLNMLDQLVQTPSGGGYPAKFFHFEPDGFVGDYFLEPAPASHWGLMTKEVLPESVVSMSDMNAVECGGRVHKYCYSGQVRSVTELSRRSGVPYEIPSLLDLITCVVLERVRTGTFLYDHSYSRASEPVGMSSGARTGEHPSHAPIVRKRPQEELRVFFGKMDRGSDSFTIYLSDDFGNLIPGVGVAAIRIFSS